MCDCNEQCWADGLPDGTNTLALRVFRTPLNVKLCVMVLYSLSFSRSYHFQWPWRNFKVTALPNCFNWIAYPIKLKRCTILNYVHYFMNIPPSDWQEKCEFCAMISVGPAGWLSGSPETLTLRFSRSIQITNVKLCMMVLRIKLYLFIPLLVTLTIFQAHGSVKQF